MGDIPANILAAATGAVSPQTMQIINGSPVVDDRDTGVINDYVNRIRGAEGTEYIQVISDMKEKYPAQHKAMNDYYKECRQEGQGPQDFYSKLTPDEINEIAGKCSSVEISDQAIIKGYVNRISEAQGAEYIQTITEMKEKYPEQHKAMSEYYEQHRGEAGPQSFYANLSSDQITEISANCEKSRQQGTKSIQFEEVGGSLPAGNGVKEGGGQQGKGNDEIHR